MDISFQDDAWKQLVGKLDRLPHALLLHGVPGVGKLALAERFAQFLLCEKKEQGTMPCGACDACRWYLAGSHPDVRLVEPEATALALGRAAAAAEEGDEEPSKDKKKPSIQIRIDQTRARADFPNLPLDRGGA